MRERCHLRAIHVDGGSRMKTPGGYFASTALPPPANVPQVPCRKALLPELEGRSPCSHGLPSLLWGRLQCHAMIAVVSSVI